MLYQADTRMIRCPTCCCRWPPACKCRPTSWSSCTRDNASSPQRRRQNNLASPLPASSVSLVICRNATDTQRATSSPSTRRYRRRPAAPASPYSTAALAPLETRRMPASHHAGLHHRCVPHRHQPLPRLSSTFAETRASSTSPLRPPRWRRPLSSTTATGTTWARTRSSGGDSRSMESTLTVARPSRTWRSRAETSSTLPPGRMSCRGGERHARFTE